MSKKTIISTSKKRALKLKVLAKKKESIRRRLVVTATKLRFKARRLAVTAQKKESIRRRLAVTTAKPRLKAKKLAVTAKEKESVRRRLAVTAENLRLKAKQLAVNAKEKESVRHKLAVTAEQLRLKAKQLAVTAKEKESVRGRLVVTAEKLAVTAKEKESVRGRLVVTAEKLAVTAKEKESVRGRLVVTAKKLAVTAKEKESVRGRLVVTAEKLAVTAKEKESVRGRLVVTAEKLAVTAKEKESVRRRLAVTAENLRLKAKQLAVTAKERESVRNKLEVTAEKLAVTAKERESIRSRLEVTAKKLASTATEKESVRKKLAFFAKEKENVRRKLVVTAEKLVVVATEKESVRKKLVVVAKQLARLAKEKEDIRKNLAVTAKEKEDIRKNLAVTAKEKESIRGRLEVTAEKLAVTAKERESIRRKLAVTAEQLRLKAKQLAVTAKERESTRRKLVVTAKDLEQIRAKNEAMLGSIGDGLVATDKNGRILLVNKAFEKILGWKEEEVRGKLMSKVIPMVDESGKEIPASERLIIKTIKERTITEEEKKQAAPETKNISRVYYYVRKDKTKFPVAVTVAPVKLAHRIIGTIEVFRDITIEKEIDKSKSEFISLASHQLKTPPTAIKLLTERLLNGKMGTFTGKQKEYIDDIHSSNGRMIDLVNALLNVSRIELGAFTIKVTEKDPCAIVQSILDELKLVIDKKQLKLKTIYPEKRSLLMLDEPLFRMVITNIVTNAIHYMAEGGKLGVLGKVIDKGQMLGEKILAEDCFVITVSDTGYGIPQKDQRKLFTKFFRADNAREKLSDGTGLGLYIAKSVLDHSGGLIWFTSRENKGSVFYVAIPMTGMRMKPGEKELSG